MGVDADNLRDTLRNFKSVEHRIEYVNTVDGVEYINDSKGTNVDATVTAIKAMKKPTVLMLGGYDKGVPLDDLVTVQDETIKMNVLYGVIAEKLKDVFEKHGKHNYVVVKGDFEEVCRKATECAKEGDCVLLSPATSSFDMFDDYEQRGRVFKEYVNRL